MFRFAATIFLGAFLLFQVQPLLGRTILPWFGGTPAVWNVCLLFFQGILLVGYAYTHGSIAALRPRAQAWLHLALLVGAVSLLPLAPSASWKPGPGDNPTLRILVLLGVTVGLPYLLLCSTSPLMQAWFARAHPERAPYRLYALSNAASLLALLSYPVVFEPNLSLGQQTGLWSATYVLFALLSASCAWPVLARARSEAPASAPLGPVAPGPGWRQALLWLALAACGSAMLLATTNELTHDLAVVPFLWILPLSLYLLTFIICFDRPHWYSSGLYTTALVLALGVACVLLASKRQGGLTVELLGYSAVLFVCCMFCHGELERAKPHPEHLTLFYLMLASGGALGGLSVAIVAPAVFPDHLEYHAGLLLAALLLVIVRIRQAPEPDSPATPRPARRALVPGIGALGLAVFLVTHVPGRGSQVIARDRNFYGVLRVEQRAEDGQEPRTILMHGAVLHGLQLRTDTTGERGTSYYGPESGVGLAIRQHPRRARSDSSLRVGGVGLGVGTIAAHARRGDRFRFYEINPMAEVFAREHFGFLRGATERGATVDVLLGDARIVMERQLERGEAQRFDVLAVDAFTGGAIPVHLLTAECMRIYWQHLAPDGVLAVHVSTLHVDLVPVIRRLAERVGHEARVVDDPSDHEAGILQSRWVLVTNNPTLIQTAERSPGHVPWKDNAATAPLWTDDFSSLYPLLTWF